MKKIEIIKIVSLFLIFASTLSAKSKIVDRYLGEFQQDGLGSFPFGAAYFLKTNRIYVVSKEYFLEKKQSENPCGECILWEIDADNNTTQKIVLDLYNGSFLKTNLQGFMVSNSLLTANGNGNITTLGMVDCSPTEMPNVIVLSELDASKNRCRFDVGDQIEDTTVAISKIITLKDKYLAFIGTQNSKGLYLKVDGQGKFVDRFLFDRNGDFMQFTDAVLLESDDDFLCVVGFSSDFEDGHLVDMNYSLLVYDSQGNIRNQDHFKEEVLNPLVGSFVPRLCNLADGNLVVIYYKKDVADDPKISMNFGGSIWARYYTPELKLIWERSLFSVPAPFPCEIGSHPMQGFLIRNPHQQQIYHFNSEGIKLSQIQLESTDVKFPFTPFFFVNTNKKTFLIYAESEYIKDENEQKKLISRTKLTSIEWNK